MVEDMFSEAEANFKHAEKTLGAFWKLISKPLKFVWDKIMEVFEGEDKIRQNTINKLPL
jgi:hypothetical protein